MSSESNSGNERLDAIIAECYEAQEQGRSIDRAALLAKHLDLQSELTEFFADLDKMAGLLPDTIPPTPRQRLPGSDEQTSDHTDSDQSSSGLRRGRKVKYVGEYELLDELGSGGMGVVFKARQAKLKRIVALKMIRSGELAGLREVQRFQAEARAAAKLDHPGIVPVHEVGVHEGRYYYAMDFVGGGSLSKLHRDEPLTAHRAAELLKQLAEATHYAHSQGIVHRDLKPANVLLSTTGMPRITDFGLAKRLWTDEESAEASLTETGQVLGTAGYMSPEQAAGLTRMVGPAADIYALGAILYAMLTTRAPFVGESASETIRQVIHNEPIAPRLLNSKIPRDLETICLRCLQKDASHRYQTAQEVADELKLFLEERPIKARPIGRVQRTWRWCRRSPVVAGLTALALLLLLTLSIGGPSIAAVAIAAREKAEGLLAERNKEYQRAQGLLVERDQADAALREEAQRNKELAEKEARAKDEARQSEREMRRTLYRTDMRQVQRYFELSNLREVRRLLQRHIPVNADQEDLRSFAWYHWWEEAHADVQTLEHGKPVSALALSPDGRWLAVGGGDRSDPENHIKLWDLESGNEKATFAVPDDEVVGLTFREEAKSLVAVTATSWVRRWEIAEPEKVAIYHMLPGPKDFYEPLHTVAFMPGNTHAASATHEGQIVLVELDKPAIPFDGQNDELMKMLLRLPQSEQKRLGISKDMADPDKLPLAAMEMKLLGLEGRVAGKRVQSGDDEESVTLQLNADLRARGIPMMERLGKGDENTPPPSQYGGPVFAVAISPDTRYLAAGSRNGDISLFSLDNRRMVYSQPAHDGIVWSLAVSADSRLLASAGEDGVVKIWSLAEGQLLWQLEQDGVPIKCALFSADGGLLATADVANNVKLWNVQTGRVERVMKGHEAAVNCLVFHPTKPLLISGSVDGTVKFWDLQTTEDELYVPGRRTVNNIYRLADGASLMATDEFGRTHSWDVRTGRRTRVISKTLAGKPCLAFCESQGLIATVARGKENSAVIQVWNATNGALLSTIDDSHPPPVPLPLFSTSGELLVLTNSPWQTRTSDANRSVTVWNTRTGKAHMTLESDQAFEPHAFTSDESLLITLNSDQEVQAWDLTGEEKAEVRFTFSMADDDEDNNVACQWAAVSPDNTHLAAAFLSAKPESQPTAEIRLWNLETGDLEKTIDLGDVNIPVWSGEFFADGQRLLFKTVFTNWEAARPLQMELVALQQKGQQAVAARDQNRAAAIQSQMEELYHQLSNHREYRIAVCDIAAGEVATVVAGPNSWGSTVAIAGGRLLATSPLDTGQIEIYNTATGQLVSKLAIEYQQLHDLVFTPDGERVIVAMQNQKTPGVGLAKYDNLVMIWNPTTGETEGVNLGEHWMGSKTTIAVSPDGETLAGFIPDSIGGIYTGRYIPASPFSTGKLLLMPLNVGERAFVPTRPIRSHTYPASGSVFKSLDEGHLLASASVDGTIRLSTVQRVSSPITIKYDAKEGPILKNERTHFYFDVDFSPDGQTLAAAADNTVQIWDYTNEKLLHTLKGHQGFVRAVAYAPDGKHLVSGSSDGTIKIWNLDGDNQPLTIVGHTAGVSSVAISPDGKTIASGGRDKSVRLWDLDSGEEKAAFHVHTLPVTSVAFSQDGTQLAACGEDGYVKLWRAPRQSLPGPKARR